MNPTRYEEIPFRPRPVRAPRGRWRTTAWCTLLGASLVGAVGGGLAATLGSERTGAAAEALPDAHRTRREALVTLAYGPLARLFAHGEEFLGTMVEDPFGAMLDDALWCGWRRLAACVLERSAPRLDARLTARLVVVLRFVDPPPAIRDEVRTLARRLVTSSRNP